MDLESENNAIDFLLILGEYYLTRLGEAFDICKAGFNPFNSKAVIGGVTGMLYLLGTIVFLAVLLYDGFAYRSKRNAAILIVQFILFVLSFLR